MIPKVPRLSREGHAFRLMASLIVAFAAFLFLLALFAPFASATRTPTSNACVSVSAQSSTGGTLVFMAGFVGDKYDPATGATTGCGNTGITNCGNVASVTDANYCGLDAPAKSPVTYGCVEMATGTLPPQFPTTVTLSAYPDATSLGGGGSPIWTTSIVCQNNAGNTINGRINVSTTTASLTSDGQAASAAQHGSIRLFLRIQDVNVGQTYDCNSDDAGTQTAPTSGACNPAAFPAQVGVVRSDPGWSNPNMTGTAPCTSGCLKYVGGDTITTKATTNSTSYGGGHATVTAFVTDGAGPANQAGSAFSLANGVNSQTVLLEGSQTTWPQTGALTSSWVHSGFLTLSGFSGLSWWIFTTQTVPSPFTLTDSLHISWTTGDSVDRTLSFSSTAVHDNNLTAHATVSTLNRLEQGEFHQTAKDARGNTIANNEILRGWVQRATLYRDTNDFPSTDFLSGASGITPFTAMALPLATTTSGLNYHVMLEQFDTTRDDAHLKNWGNTSGELDVSSSLTVSCTLLDPVDLVTTNIVTYNPDESLKCRNVRLQWANGADVPSGFIRVFFRQSTSSAGDTTDATSCDTTTNATNVQGWALCDGGTRPQASGDVRARSSTGSAYVVEVAQFSTSARTTASNDGATAGKFDVSYSYSVACGSISVVVNRGEQTDCHTATVRNARSQLDPGAFLRTYYRRSAQPDRDTTDVPSCDSTSGTGGSAGAWTCDSTVKTTATATTGLAYVVEVAKWFGSSRNTFVVSANTSGLYDVSSALTFDGINMTKCAASVPTCDNVSAFTIGGSDNEYARAKGVRDQRGSFLSGLAISCQRTRPDSVTQPSVSMGNSDANGDSPVVQFTIEGPVGSWTMTCSTSANGNTASYSVMFFHTSAFTANIQVAVLWNVSKMRNGTYFANVSACYREFDQGTDSVIRIFPDSPPKLTVEQYDPATDLHDTLLVSRQIMTQEDTTSATCYRSNFYDANLATRDNFAYVAVNLTGSPFLGAEAFVARAAGEFTGNFTGNFTITQGGMVSGMISTAIDQYLPILVWGVMLAILIYFTAWAPALGALIGLLDGITGYSLSFMPGLVGDVFLTALLFVLHALVANGLLPRPFQRRGDEKGRELDKP